MTSKLENIARPLEPLPIASGPMMTQHAALGTSFSPRCSLPDFMNLSRERDHAMYLRTSKPYMRLSWTLKQFRKNHKATNPTTVAAFRETNSASCEHQDDEMEAINSVSTSRGQAPPPVLPDQWRSLECCMLPTVPTDPTGPPEDEILMSKS